MPDEKTARVKIKRPSYRDAVDAIAWNDEPAEHDADAVAGMASVVIIASIFGVPSEQVAADVVAYRLKHNV